MRAYTLTTLIVCGLAGIVLGVPAIAQSGATAPPEIQADYQKLDAALENRDAETLLKAYTWNAKFFDVQGHVVTRAQIADKVRNGVRDSQSISSHTIIKNVNVAKDGITVTVEQKISATDIDPDSAVLNNTVSTVDERDHWIEIGSRWKINRTRILSAYVMRNGQSVHGKT